MSLRPAQYLFRFDDLCPTMARVRWKRFERLIEEFAVRPILAVVPDNRDTDLMRDPSDPDFWKKMRAWEDAGATIALHGFRHICASTGRSLVPAHAQTEFAGVPVDVQHGWIREGLCILRAHGLHPRLWVAPRHGFDAATLHALREEGIIHISDGFARVPFVRAGVTWIPQQLWGLQVKRAGLWTVCLHTNTARVETAEKLRSFLSRHRERVTSFERVNSEWHPGQLGLVEKAHEVILSARRIAALRRRAGATAAR
jgi:predicted deacetylase